MRVGEATGLARLGSSRLMRGESGAGTALEAIGSGAARAARASCSVTSTQGAARADIEAKARRTPILGAVESGIPELLERMIALGAKPDTLVNDIGTTALHAAAALENAQMVEILLKHGAKVNAKSTTGITPLLNAVNFNNLECVRVLIQYGADPDIAAIDGMTPRALAMKQQRWEITKLLNSPK